MSKFKGIFEANKKSEKNEPKRAATTKPAGRIRGKRSNPDYEQVTAYIRKETYRDVKIALLQEHEMDDFSDLVEKLLNQWLKVGSK